MMEEELRQLLKEHGWTMYKRKRGKYQYFYALKWKKDQVYITSERALPELTPDKVLEKITAA